MIPILKNATSLIAISIANSESQYVLKFSNGGDKKELLVTDVSEFPLRFKQFQIDETLLDLQPLEGDFEVYSGDKLVYKTTYSVTTTQQDVAEHEVDKITVDYEG